MKSSKTLALVMLIGFGVGAIIGATLGAPKVTAASDAGSWAKCGIKPPPPNGFWPEDAACLCSGDVCKWVWIRH